VRRPLISARRPEK
jgi:hypothetical protein